MHGNSIDPGSIQGGHDSKITFIVRPLHYISYTFYMFIPHKMHVYALPMHMSKFDQDLNFQQGACASQAPLKSPMLTGMRQG